MIKLSHIVKSYKIDDETTFTALYDASIVIKDGELVSIIGPSGSGKSTLMHIIGLLDKPTSGEVLINGQDIAKLSDDELSELRHNLWDLYFNNLI